MEEIINTLKFDASGLIPAVVQNVETNEVLMVAYMNADTIRETVKSGRATFWSRSRRAVWVKGETSGNYMYVKEIRVDCDCDCLLLLVNPAGAACHTGNRSCFFRKIEDGKIIEDTAQRTKSDIFEREQAVIKKILKRAVIQTTCLIRARIRFLKKLVKKLQRLLLQVKTAIRTKSVMRFPTLYTI